MELKFFRTITYEKFCKYFGDNALDPTISITKNNLKKSLNFIGISNTKFMLTGIYKFNTQEKYIVARRHHRLILDNDERFNIVKYFIKVAGSMNILPPRSQNRILVFDPFDETYKNIDKLTTNE